MSWCVCKCVRPRSGEDSSSGDGNLKQVDGYANAVRATFCGNLASVVCVSGKKLLAVFFPAVQHPRAQAFFFLWDFFGRALVGDGLPALGISVALTSSWMPPPCMPLLLPLDFSDARSLLLDDVSTQGRPRNCP